MKMDDLFSQPHRRRSVHLFPFETTFAFVSSDVLSVLFEASARSIHICCSFPVS